jgi:hypothetical protein
MAESKCIGHTVSSDTPIGAYIIYIYFKPSKTRGRRDILRIYNKPSILLTVGPRCFGHMIVLKNIEIAHAYGSDENDANSQLTTYWKSLTTEQKNQKLRLAGVDIDSNQSCYFVDEIDLEKN